MLLAFAAAVALTPADAQRLPIAELARRVLGAAGTLAIDAERPTWPRCIGLCPPEQSHGEGPPPLDHITFFTRASAVGWAGWTGLCTASRIEVRFDAAGEVTSLAQTETVGAAGPLAREVVDAPGRTRQQAEHEARCGALATTGGFFPAPDRLSAWRAAIAVELVHRAMDGDGTLRVGCEINGFGPPENCATPAELRNLADRVMIASITGAEAKVTPRPYDTRNPVERGCLAIRMAQPFGAVEELNACFVDDFTAFRVTAATFRRSRVIY